MADVMVATNEADAKAAEAVEQHHAMLASALATRVQRLLTSGHGWQPARDDLVVWCRAELLPHAQAEEKTLYPAAAAIDVARLLVDAMIVEHGVLVQLVDELGQSAEASRAAGTAIALQTLFEAHLAKENDQILPLLAQSAGVDLAGLLGGMHELLGGHEHEGHAHAAGGCGDHECTCGEVDGPGYPELDARVVPHAIRHATVFGALDAVGPGGGLVLVAPHDPLPLLAQIEQRNPGAFDVSYLERGPEAWRLLFTRT